ncbi:benzoate 4-monooxygenase cytochrome P450 [Aspergillus eucalypticola CBS 122712]|uniref:Benzoate 4-monooxygenase cytochrome P450 n=1 Tax=Aspergillus eucalypticola (strain CBS 122712 / IBT 29274) TaxID=1448314 RepID=A0A317W6U9_ASPEC|nr:benzoate 4-monooxygenase cytochrome P450 [Aspergillus eucalypticola CBS 122712]PWY82364.1 benzoate 4-monooxygenase cytochrome P450 [Aspergillus eucalypticola CBS 122712]
MPTVLALVGISYLAYTICAAIWNIYLHPLRRIPGPKLWLAFPILRYISNMRGVLDRDMRALHKRYGGVVRFTPNEVSFITTQAWKDIYGHGHRQLPKVSGSASNPKDIISANDSDHTRFRKAISHAFSAKGLQAQEPFIMEYVDKLINKLHSMAESEVAVDMAKWYNLTTFDLIGDLAFGQSFGGLDSKEYHYWVSTIFEFIKAIAFARFKDDYPMVFNALKRFLPKHLLEAKRRQDEYSWNTVQTRLHDQTDRGQADFMQSMLRHRGDKDGLTDEELAANASILVIAGSETTATLLSGLTYWLLQHPKEMEKVKFEVRSVMKTEEDITVNNATAKLPYMLACIDEAFRMYPPVAGHLQRYIPDQPTEISGYLLPKEASPTQKSEINNANTFQTRVSVHQSAAYWSSLNFYKPEEFIPERWLPESKNDPSSPFYHDNREILQPFSIGPRNCIGRNLAYAEMRVIFARVLWNFDIELCEESREWHNQKSYNLWAKPPLMCKLKARVY